MTKQAVFAIVYDQKKKRILAVKRKDTPIWVLPGGGVDLGENPETAALREVKEESGIDASITRKLAEYTPINRITHLAHLYEGIAEHEDTSLTSETVDVGFFYIDDLPEPFFQLHRDMIEDVLTSKVFPYQKPQSQVTYWNVTKFLFKHPIILIRALFAKLGIPINF